MAKIQDITVTRETIGDMFRQSCPGPVHRADLWHRIAHGQTGIYSINNDSGFIAITILPSSLHVEYCEGKNVVSRAGLKLLETMARMSGVYAITVDVRSESKLERVLSRLGFHIFWRKIRGGISEVRLVKVVVYGKK